MAISGCATPEGTQQYTLNQSTDTDDSHFNDYRGLRVSSIGLGTYLGDATDEIDEDYENAVRECVSGGINHVDTAINYRFQRSERSIGRALETLIAEGEYTRDQLFVASKGGFIPFESEEPEDPMDYIASEFIQPGVVKPDDFTRNGHCMEPDYLEHQLDQTLGNLGLECLDAYYVHNPETQLSETRYEDLMSDLERAFTRLEDLVAEGRIARYGIATWDGLRVDPEAEEYLALQDVVEAARAAGGDDHHFEAVQLPLNLGMSEALTKGNQTVDGEALTPLEACRRFDLLTVTSASILQGRLAKTLPDEIRDDLEEFDSDALRALQFTRSAPGVTSALVGMKQPDHIDENLKLTKTSPYPETDFTNRFLREVPE